MADAAYLDITRKLLILRERRLRIVHFVQNGYRIIIRFRRILIHVTAAALNICDRVAPIVSELKFCYLVRNIVNNVNIDIFPDNLLSLKRLYSLLVSKKIRHCGDVLSMYRNRVLKNTDHIICRDTVNIRINTLAAKQLYVLFFVSAHINTACPSK